MSDVIENSLTELKDRLEQIGLLLEQRKKEVKQKLEETDRKDLTSVQYDLLSSCIQYIGSAQKETVEAAGELSKAISFDAFLKECKNENKT